ncbi:MAG: DUF2062 domain-containing protein [Candidatus Omnitrophica bacterium]|nr:DUF2062 domain-containing protein [Candidatus Omnitrophota bacterium]
MKVRPKDLWAKLKEASLSSASPSEIALGIGIGSFIGVFPVQGVKTPLVFLIKGICKKANLLAIFATSSIFSFPVVVPFIYFFDHWLGCKILGVPLIFSLQTFKNFNWQILKNGLASLFLGGGIAGLILGLLTFWGTLLFLKLRSHG